MTSQKTADVKQKLSRAVADRLGSTDIDLMMQLITVLRSETKEKLLRCSAEEFPRLQGEGMAYDNLIRIVSRKPLPKTLTE